MKFTFIYLFTASMLVTLMLNTEAYAQDCECDHTLVLDPGFVRIIRGEDMDYSPGDTFCMNAGTFDAIRFIGFHGTEEQPLIFKNCGGQVEINSSVYAGISFWGSSHIVFDGSGHEGTEYGFKVSQTPGSTSGMVIAELSTDFEVHHVEIGNTGFAGIQAKTDPRCDDPAKWRENFTMRNLHFHHNYIHDTHGEGFYIGFTGGWTSSIVVCDGVERFGHLLENVDVHHNLFERIGWDGIQVSLGLVNTKIHHNTIRGYGTGMMGFQNFGIASGGGNRAHIYNNMIVQELEYAIDGNFGIQVVSPQTDFYVYNNVIINSGDHGIWTHVREESEHLELDKGFYFFNNTVIDAGRSGLKDPDLGGSGIFFFQTAGPDTRGEDIINVFANNLIVDPFENYENSGFWKVAEDAFIDYGEPDQKLFSIRKNNIYTRSKDDMQFSSSGDYSLTENSPAVDAGVDLSEEDWYKGFNFDHLDEIRPSGAWDVGAYEFLEPLGIGLSPEALSEKHIPFEVYPVPSTNGEIHLSFNEKFEFNNVGVEIYDRSGKLVFQNAYSPTDFQKASTLNLAIPYNLQTGIYYITVRTSETQHVRKIIIRD